MAREDDVMVIRIILMCPTSNYQEASLKYVQKIFLIILGALVSFSVVRV